MKKSNKFYYKYFIKTVQTSKAIVLIISFLQFFALNLISAQDKTLTKDGIKLNFKSKTSVGKDASICTYCQDVKKSIKCNELLIAKNGSKIWIPVSSGPVYNVIRTGKTPNYNSLKLLKSKNGGITQYYTTKDNLFIILTPLKQSNLISVFKYGTKPLTDKDVNVIFLDNGSGVEKDECKCIENWQNCYINTSVLINEIMAESGITYPDDLIFHTIEDNCDKSYEDCKEMCKNIEMEHLGRILTFKKSSSSTNFQIAINTK